MADDIVVTEMSICDSKLFPWWLILVWGILTLLIGCMFIITPGLTVELFITFVGAYWLVGGIFAIASLVVDKSNMGWKIFLSVINILAGIVILLHPLFAAIFALTFFVIFIGFWALFIGVAHLYHGLSMKDAGNAVLGLLSLIIGLLILVFPLGFMISLPYVAGGLAVIFGLASIFVSFVAKKCQDTPAACTP
jgi:uncharacterized membrane protein HdeD (DUF308 family)